MKIVTLHKNIEQLLPALRKQDRLAQKHLFDIKAGKMLGICRMYIKDIQHSEDVLLMGFAKVFRNIDKYDEKGSFEGWIRRIMINESLDFIRSRKELHFSEEEHYSDERCDTVNELYSVEEIQYHIDQLPEGCKSVFVMYVVEGYKHYEIAELLQISEGTSKSQLAHARKLLQKSLQNYERDENQYRR